jgi:tetratricopeptide (TPR) repeat protein
LKFFSLFLIISIFITLFYSCAIFEPNLKTLSETAPDVVVAKQDSLLALSKEKRPEFVTILTTAHINIARRAEKSGDISVAVDEYKKVLKIDPKNKTARYELLVLEGLNLYRKGSKSALWDAIELFSKATSINADSGVANYWIAKSYEKKDSKDFELIIEAYEKALTKKLPEDIRQDAENAKNIAYKNKTTLDKFWK